MEKFETNDVLKDEVLRLLESEEGPGRAFSRCRAAAAASPARKGKGQERFFSAALEAFIRLDIDEAEAARHWAGIAERSASLSRALGRRVGLHTAVVDYFTSSGGLLRAPLIVEAQSFKRTERMAMMDGLTGAFNRRYMEMGLKKEFNRCSRYGKGLSVFILDIDGFKAINDSRGHAFGDETLRELSRFLRAAVREEDAVCRYGGEEFLVILPETSGAGAYVLAERIRLSMKEVPFFRDNRIAFSGGTASYPENGATAAQLVEAADRALYLAKSSGKDRILRAVQERRRHGRFPRSWALTIDVAGGRGGGTGGPVRDILTLDVSMGGLRFECPSRLDIDEAVDLGLTALDSSGERVSARGRVSWVRREDDELFSYGVSFSDLSERAVEILSSTLTEDGETLAERGVLAERDVLAERG